MLGQPPRGYAVRGDRREESSVCPGSSAAASLQSGRHEALRSVAAAVDVSLRAFPAETLRGAADPGG